MNSKLERPKKAKHHNSITKTNRQPNCSCCLRNLIFRPCVDRVRSLTATWWVEGTPEKSIWTGTFPTWTHWCTTTRRQTGETTTCHCRTTGSNRSVLLDNTWEMFTCSPSMWAHMCKYMYTPVQKFGVAEKCLYFSKKSTVFSIKITLN